MASKSIDQARQFKIQNDVKIFTYKAPDAVNSKTRAQLSANCAVLPSWSKVQSVLVGNRTLRAVQKRAFDAGLCSGRRNMVIAAPTNSGKS